LALTPGTCLGPYEVGAQIGVGGMGEVYRATDTRLGRDVALKVLPPGLAGDPDRLARFRREARALAAFDHPAIVTVFSVEDAELGGQTVHFLTMQLVDGLPLDRVIPSGGLPAERVLSIGRAVAEVLAAAHDKGIVHRDLKPANVMLTADGRVKVLDFGLAKDLRQVDRALATVTSAGATAVGVVMGTPAYMSPEQVIGRTLDHRTDVFSLGTLLYEAATGQRPFEGPSSAELASAILRDTPRPVDQLRDDVPADLARVIGTCLQKDPERRYQSARHLVDALEAAGVAPASRSRAETNRADVAIAVLAFADMSAARDQQYLCEGMAEEIMNALVRIPGLHVASRMSAFRAQRDGSDIQAIGRTLSVGHVLDGSVRTLGNRLRVTAQLTDVATGFQLWSDRYDRDAADVFAVQDEIAAGVVEAVRTQLAPGAHVVRARPQVGNLDAYQQYLMGRHLRYGKSDHAGAVLHFERATRLDPEYGPAWVGLAETLVLAAAYGLMPPVEAHAGAKRALFEAARLQGEQDGLYVEGLIALGERRWSDALRVMTRSTEVTPGSVEAHCWLALVQTVHGRHEAAAASLARARDMDPLSEYPYAMSGVRMLAMGDPASARAFFDRATAIGGQNSLTLWGAVLAEAATGCFDGALPRLEAIIARTPQPGFFHATAGWGLALAGRRAEARALLEALRSRPAGAPSIYPEAWLLAALGELDAAMDVVEAAEREHQLLIGMVRLPGNAPLAGHPRFRALVSRLGLPATGP